MGGFKGEQGSGIDIRVRHNPSTQYNLSRR